MLFFSSPAARHVHPEDPLGLGGEVRDQRHLHRGGARAEAQRRPGAEQLEDGLHVGHEQIPKLNRLHFGCGKVESVGCGSNQRYHFGVSAPPILVYFSGNWDVHWGYGILTHGQLIFLGGSIWKVSYPRNGLRFWMSKYLSKAGWVFFVGSCGLHLASAWADTSVEGFGGLHGDKTVGTTRNGAPFCGSKVEFKPMKRGCYKADTSVEWGCISVGTRVHSPLQGRVLSIWGRGLYQESLGGRGNTSGTGSMCVAAR